jgi:hypothetical protein
MTPRPGALRLSAWLLLAGCASSRSGEAVRPQVAVFALEAIRFERGLVPLLPDLRGALDPLAPDLICLRAIGAAADRLDLPLVEAEAAARGVRLLRLEPKREPESAAAQCLAAARVHRSVKVAWVATVAEAGPDLAALRGGGGRVELLNGAAPIPLASVRQGRPVRAEVIEAWERALGELPEASPLRLGIEVLVRTFGSTATGAFRRRLDEFTDARFEAPGAAQALARELSAAGFEAAHVERMLRANRVSYPPAPQPPGQLTYELPLSCDHVDYQTAYTLYVPSSYLPSRPVPLVIVGHGGNGAMDKAYAARASKKGTEPYWIEQAERHGFLVAAPLTERGWGAIGNSIVLSLISKLQREYNVDPDRLYVSGHSMGGHLSFRSAINLGDRFGAVAPMSGGYDYVKSGEVLALFNTPGYVTYGTDEPYEINTFNNRMREWTAARGFSWVFREKQGGHEIFADELGPMASYLLERPRELYAPRVFARAVGALEFSAADRNERWNAEHQWRKGRPITASTFKWLRLFPQVGVHGEPAPVQQVWAEVKERRRIEITSMGARRLRLYLHPRLVDLSSPIEVWVNGVQGFGGRVDEDLASMLELVREFDDRGRVFYAAVDLEVGTDQPPPVPGERPSSAAPGRPGELAHPAADAVQ